MKNREPIKSQRRFAVQALAEATHKDKNLYANEELAFKHAPLNSLIYPVEVIIIK